MKPRFPIHIIVLLMSAALPLPAAAAGAGAAEAPFRFYTVLDGLTQSEVNAVAQDHAGYLWFTTARGLNRYDGKDFDHYTIANGLPSNSLTALRVDESSAIWVGDRQGGITIMHGARIAHTIEPVDEFNAPIIDIEFVGEVVLAVVEGAGVLEISAIEQQFRISPLNVDNAGGITNVAVSGADVWAVSESGLYQLTLGSEPQLQLLDKSIRRIHIDVTGTIWVADVDGRVGVWEARHFKPVARVVSDHEIVSIVTDHSGNVWAATADELFSFNGLIGDSAAIDLDETRVRRYTGVDQVSSLFVDRENSLWLASESRLIRFLGDRFRHHRLRTTADPENVWSIGEDRNGKLWFGTETKLLLKEFDDSIIVVGPAYGIPEGPVRDIAVDRNGDIWTGITGAGLFRIDVDSLKATHVSETEGLEIFDIEMATDNAIWFTTKKSGVFRYLPADDSLTTFRTPNETSVYTLDIGPDSKVWFGADEVGLIRLVPNGSGGFDQHLIPGSDALANLFFDHVRVTGEETAWIATEEGGLYQYKDGEFSDYGTATPLADQTVYLVEQLPNGSIVVGGEQGLYQFVPGKPGLAHFNQHVGFVGLETNVHATYVDSENGLWIGTVDGSTRMDIEMPMPDKTDPVVRIVRVETELDRKQVFDDQEIEARQLGARVKYAAISLLNPRGMEYMYKLVGIDTDWSLETTNRSVSYPRIPPGSYEFMVRARYPGGKWSENHASHRFTVLPFFWQQAWFIGIAILAVLLTLGAATEYRTRKIEWTNKTLRAQVLERTQSIEMARQNLELSNEQLSQEIVTRVELEARFRGAFENAPIGMGLLDPDAMLFDANSALKNMFWPNVDVLPKKNLTAVIGDGDQDRFVELFQKIIVAELDSLDERFTCVGADGEVLRTVFNISAVRSDANEFLYAVLQIQDVTESQKLTSQLEQQATSDELTGLLNRRAFEAELERAWNAGPGGKASGFLMFMDLDQFKIVNDTSGHAAGDELLRSITNILVDGVRAHDIVARLGGDEFGIILWECPTEIATRIAESIRASIETFRFHWDAETYRIGVSIGGLPIDPKLGDIGELQQLADAACYTAKEAGRNRVHIVGGDMDTARVHRGQVRWVHRIRDAMDNNKFAIYAQPIRSLSTVVDEPERLEVLLRLRDPETRKLVPPGAFLPATERYGLSVELDKWVVKSLLNMLFVHQAVQAEQRSYWVNLSGTSIGDEDFSKFLMEAIETSPLPPGTINFEITETAVIRNVAEAGKLMSALREMGCQFALDDFGSGLSSFGYLRKLPLDYLKIDGMFIRDLLRDKTDRIFVKSIIDIAHALNIKAVAEFVENDELLQLVRELGADYAQGFAIGRPFVLAPQFPRETNSGGAATLIHDMAG